MKLMRFFKGFDRCAFLGVVALVLTFLALTLLSTQSIRADEFPVEADSTQGVGY